MTGSGCSGGGVHDHDLEKLFLQPSAIRAAPVGGRGFPGQPPLAEPLVHHDRHVSLVREGASQLVLEIGVGRPDDDVGHFAVLSQARVGAEDFRQEAGQGSAHREGNGSGWNGGRWPGGGARGGGGGGPRPPRGGAGGGGGTRATWGALEKSAPAPPPAGGLPGRGAPTPPPLLLQPAAGLAPR